MKKTLFTAIFAILAIFEFAEKKQQQTKKESDSLKTEERKLTGFHGIEAGFCFKIKLVKGDSEKVTIKTKEEYLPYVKTEVEGGILKLSFKKADADKSWWKRFWDEGDELVKPLLVEITVKQLNSIELSGSCKLTSEETFNSSDFSIDLSGAATAILNLDVTTLSIQLSGASKSNLIAKASSATIDLAGATKMTLNLTASEKVSIDNSGASKMTLRGSAKNMSVDVSGASNLSASEFQCEKVSIESSGASSITVNATEALNISSSGASKIRYKGTPKMKINSSGASSIQSFE
jgi:hypothetical protein